MIFRENKSEIKISGSIISKNQEGDNYYIKDSKVEVNLNKPLEISPEQRMKILSILSKYEPQSVRLTFCGNCEGSQIYGEQINDIFKEVGWGVSGPAITYGNFEGVNIVINNKKHYPKAADIIYEAFRAGDIKIDYSLDPDMNQDYVVIVVGIIK